MPVFAENGGGPDRDRLTSEKTHPKPSQAGYLRQRVASFGYAGKGLIALLRTQPHAKLHLLATALVVAFGYVLQVSLLEAACLFMAIGIVWCAEAMNTAIEWLVDLVHPQWHADAGRIKDVAAAGVLLAAIGAFGAGICIFLPKIWRLLQLG